MHPEHLQRAFAELSQAMATMQKLLEEMQAEHDPLAVHIFAARRRYRNAHDSKSGRHREVTARLSYTKARELGYDGTLHAWEELMGAMPKR